MRVALFVLVGIVLGVVGARLRAKSKPSSADVVPAKSVVEATSRSSPATTGFVYKQRVSQHDILPTDIRYDPVALRSEEADLTVKDIFEREPRDAAFAPVMEKRIRDTLDIAFHELKLEGKIRSVHTECKTLSCYTYIQVAKTDERPIYSEINPIMLGDDQQPGRADDADPDLSDVTIYNLYRPDMRNDAAYKKFLEAATWPQLEYIKRSLLKEQNEAPH